MKKKSLVKEIFILIVLLILVLLIVAVSLYDFIPTNINVPETVTYSADSKTTSIKQEIAYTNGGDATADPSQTDTELVTSLKSYSINSSDLTVYGQKNLYNSGNSNPFDYATEEAPPTTTPENTTTTNTTTTPGQTNNSNAGQTTTNESGANTSTPGTFFEKPNSK